MPTLISPSDPAPDYLGFVEQAGETCVRGWAIDRARLPQAAQVAVLGPDGPIAIAYADRPRPDVAQAGFPAAACGFELRLPRGAPRPPCVVFWPDRVVLGAVEGVTLGEQPVVAPGNRLGVVTSWHAGCGIADYARIVVQGLSGRFDITVFAADSTAMLPADGVRIDAGWHNSDAGLELLCESLEAVRPDILLVEHHPGVLAWPRLAALIEYAHASCIGVHVRLHTLRGSLADLRAIRPALRLCASVLVHTQNDLDFVAATLPGARGRFVPHGVAAPPPRGTRRRAAGAIFHVGAFGFMHGYKGIAQHLRALHLLREHVPEVRATLLHAVTGDPASAAAAVECFALRQRLGLDDAVDIDTRLLPMEAVAARLAGCDVLVFAYQGTAESASGAACALAGLGVPMLATPSAIFAGLQAACHVACGSDAYAIAAKLLALANDRAALRATLPALANYARAQAWPVVTSQVAQILLPAAA
jgi:glycosyltransferase involved in cell wall biosynthesis